MEVSKTKLKYNIGAEVSTYVAANLVAKLLADDDYNDRKYEAAFKAVFRSLDEDMRSEGGQAELKEIAKQKKEEAELARGDEEG
jgi:hypothetical protein